MSTPALLLFAHQARSYATMIKAFTDRLGVALVILSSKPRDPRDLEQTAAVGAARLWHVEDEYLDDSHVETVLAEARNEGIEVIAALATFEGYRLLMARANRLLGAVDADPGALRTCMDKLLCRQRLSLTGLSRARAVVLDAATLPALQAALADGRPSFVKPRRGAGSFACFRFDETVTLDRLHALQDQMRGDKAFRAIFAGEFDFIAEDYVRGDEYSFEVIASAGETYVIGVHAKYVDDASGTTLEMGNSLPAPRLTDAQQLAGERFVGRCLAALQLHEGCYHIETRYDAGSDHWDIIEINARMGGALINQSVGVFTNGLCMLELWVQTLCNASTGAAAREQRAKLTALRESTRRSKGEIDYGSVFFSRYGERNRTLEVLSIDQLNPPPHVVDIPVRPNTKLPDSERGIFILNALWKVPVVAIAEQLYVLSAMLDDKLVVRYSDAAAIAADTTTQEKP
jgi:biotin carboxylase